ncbi:MptD family putative ECF transporter S component [Actinomyces sp. B33]|uniref:MptD family putative ECF transporter S component n=1 Tax=Actinomyces sp. B33 TaxID=2942131 RepID=UPI0023407E9F|nr:MptD family putative ECF transporter S component [Actinomyces sp. B33]MDC4233678.1 MptD family putative ECF transporter S component [Actinomyces sp. B33]
MPPSPAPAPTGRGPSVTDLVVIGALAAVYFVVLGASTMLTLISPAFHLVGITLSTFLNAFVVMALLARSPRMGTLTIFGSVVTAVMVLLGQFWGSIVLGAACGLAADLVRRALGETTRRGAVWSYGVLQLWLIGPLLPVILTPEAFFGRIAVRRGADYVAAMEALFTPTNLVIFHVLNALAGVAFAALAARALHRHFERSQVL